MYYHGRWDKLQDLERRIVRYHSLMLLDSCILINGRITSELDKKDIEQMQYDNIKNGTGFGTRLEAQNLLEDEVERVVNGSANKIEACAETSWKITEAVRYWRIANPRMITVIPDFIQDESTYVAETKHRGRNDGFFKWMYDIRSNNEGTYIFLMTPFGNCHADQGSLKEYLKKAPETHVELAKLMDSPCDTALVLTALHLYDWMRRDIGIVSDDVIGFSSMLDHGFDKYAQGPVNTKKIKCYKSKNFWKLISKDNKKIF